ncbi:hypothetical protein GYA27_03090 [candidate division WWE3 bacterium]|uniref:Uncharacterized protein n=1 Tax=candidate division WWE3 bacterium TaxID=2053526 RepID=A0A7X9HGR2_UNCKA|nr:hypothetical protein [candidate division WWE3 bacterium]
MNRNRGFAVPIVLVFTLVFLILPLIFWYSFNVNSAETVKGTSVKSEENSVLVKIVSPSGPWDLQQYLCKDKNECTASVFSGKRYATISGGKTQGHYLPLTSPKSSGDYKFLKVFVTAGSGLTTADFKVLDSQVLLGHSIEKMTLAEESLSLEAVLIPLESFVNTTGATESIDFIAK